MIVCQGIKKSYGDLQVLKGLDLEIEAGEVVAIVGSSGAGKSTLLHIMGTLDRADAGELRIYDTNVGRLDDKALSSFRNANIGFVFQFHHLLPEFTAIENITIPAMISGANVSEKEKRGIELLDYLGLADRVKHRPSELSGGEQQRVAFARALINQPKVIFADEPTGNLDSKTSDELHQLIFDLRAEFNQTFVIVTHNPALADMADRKLLMQDGFIVS